MTETYYAGAYWRARSESIEACARRAAHFFELLSRCDPAWTHWHETANSFEQARNRRFMTTAASFQNLFARKEHRIGDGFSFHLWTGENLRETSSVNGTCGSEDPWLSSACVLQPYDEGPVAERMLTAPIMLGALRAMALAWEPEWAVATSHQHRELAAPGFPHPGTFVGWILYFSRMRGKVPPLPSPVRIEPVEDKGTLVLLTPEKFTVSAAEHMALASRVHEVLNEAGLLQPLQPWPVSG
ncbi:immunity 52 family protein [Stigmatella erecta]|uniref:Immunity protein 52 n=1 Tax=Stigmatella erecta TaxID=83460 RepID=A0A1I0L5D3_9BACT|nr:immunity 52 family protein [Stigmatella erecta]SEU34108.1 Immunity protein 52 [Stigmatella erecta]